MSSHAYLPRFTVRPYYDMSDITRIVEFVQAVRPLMLWTEYPSIYEIPDLLSLPANQITARLWLNEQNQLVGYAYVDLFQTLRFDLDWRMQDNELGNEILTWGKECLKNKHPFLYSTSHEADSERLAFFERHEFVRCPESIVHMECSLDSNIPPPRVPDEYTIREVKGEDEAAEIIALHRAAFRTSYMTIERRVHMMRQNDYDQTLDLVAVASDGRLVAYALGQVTGPEAEQGIGYADLFATHPDHRGRGLAQALMSMVVDRLQQKGYRIAKLSTDSDNYAMQHVAHSVGFQITGETLRFERQVDFATE